MPKHLKWLCLSMGGAVLTVLMGLGLIVQIVRASCGPNNLGEFCSSSYLLVGKPSAVNVPLSNTAPTVPVVDQAQILPAGPLLYTDYKVLEAEARELLDRSVKFRLDISPYRQTNNFNKLVRQFDVNAGFSEPYDDPNSTVPTMTLQQRIDLADTELKQARNLYGVLAVYAPEPRMRTDGVFITDTVPNFVSPLCGRTSKENPNPPDPQFTGQVLDAIVDWCDFPARLRQAAREAAYMRMIFGQQFMVDALGLNFGSNLLGGEEYVKKEVAKLDAARNQFQLAQKGLTEALSYRLGDGCYLSDFYTQFEWALLSQAAELQMTAQHHMAIRQSYLSISTAADAERAEDTAMGTFRASSIEGYLKLVGMSGVTATGSAAASFCNAKGARPENVATAALALDIVETMEKARELKAGRNVFGFDERFTPARSYRTAFGSTDKGLWEQAKEAAQLAGETQAQANAAGRAFDLNQQDLKKAILATNNVVDNEVQVLAGCDLKDFGTSPDPDTAWYACVDEMIKNTSECDPTQDSFDACMNRTTDGLPPKSDGSNWLILVSDMRTSRQDLRVAWLGVKAAIKKRDNLVKRAETETWRNSKVTSLILNGAQQASVYESIIAAANCCVIEAKFPPGLQINPGAFVEAGLRPAEMLSEAANTMDIEDTNSEAVIRNFFLDMAEAQGEIDTALQQFQSQLTQFNGVVGQTGHDVFQSKREHAYTKSLPANDPGYRMTRDSLRLLLASQLDLAARTAYLAARRAEYELTARLSGSNFRISDIYKARNANDILDFLNRLDATVNNLPGAIKDAETNQSDLTVSVAQHVLGLSDKRLQGEGFSGAAIQIERVRRFRAWVSANTIVGGDGKPRLTFAFAFSADPNGILSSVLQQGFDYYWLHKVGGIGQPKPGSNGFGVNLITAQSGELGFRQTRVNQTGQVNLTSFAGCHFDYRLIAPAVMLGLDFPNTQPSDEVSGLFSADVNGKHGNTTAGYSTPAFLGRPVASNGWQVTVFAGSPNGILPDMDLQQLNDIELKISTVHASRPSNTPPQPSACTRVDF